MIYTFSTSTKKGTTACSSNAADHLFCGEVHPGSHLHRSAAPGAARDFRGLAVLPFDLVPACPVAEARHQPPSLVSPHVDLHERGVHVVRGDAKLATALLDCACMRTVHM